MIEELPAPNWSPTGENGYWVWHIEKWRWYSDEEYEKYKELKDSYTDDE